MNKSNSTGKIDDAKKLANSFIYLNNIMINSSKVIPTTAEQVHAYCVWVTGKFLTYVDYSSPTQNEEIAVHIRTHLFTHEMISVWRESEPYVGVRNVRDLHVHRIQLYRTRLDGKIKYMKEKLGKLAFPIEAANMRAEYARQALLRWAPQPRVVIIWLEELQQPLKPTKKIETLSEKDASKQMECVICMSNHLVVDTCLINCGHRFGAKCFAKWEKSVNCANCPLCRDLCTEVTEYFYE